MVSLSSTAVRSCSNCDLRLCNSLSLLLFPLLCGVEEPFEVEAEAGVALGAEIVALGVGVGSSLAGAGAGVGAGAEPVPLALLASGTLPVLLTPLPVSKLTMFLAALFPSKKSFALNAGTALGASGKISLWKLSAFLGTQKETG